VIGIFSFADKASPNTVGNFGGQRMGLNSSRVRRYQSLEPSSTLAHLLQYLPDHAHETQPPPVRLFPTSPVLDTFAPARCHSHLRDKLSIVRCLKCTFLGHPVRGEGARRSDLLTLGLRLSSAPETGGRCGPVQQAPSVGEKVLERLARVAVLSSQQPNLIMIKI